MNLRLVLLLAVLVALAGQAVGTQGEPPAVTAALKQADWLFKEQQWSEAAVRYDGARDALADWRSPTTRRAVEGAVACAAKLTRWDDAVDRLEAYIGHNADGLGEVAGQRLLAGFYLSMPQPASSRAAGSCMGSLGKVKAATPRKAMGGRRSDAWNVRATWPRDSPRPCRPARLRRIVRRSSRRGSARTSISPRSLTRINVVGKHFLDQWLSVLPPLAGGQDSQEPPLTGASARDFQEPYSGLPPCSDGAPTFATLLAAYNAGLTPAEKHRLLLAEVERIDTSAHRDAAAEAVFRRAALARFFYGPQTAQEWADWWQNNRSYHADHSSYRAGNGPRPPVPETKVWQLRDDQALTPVGGWLRAVDLPAWESPLALIAAVEERYPQSAILPEARYARALYLQGRQQYPRALAEYRAVAEQTPAGPRAKDARAQIQEIEQPGVSLGDTETYFPGERPTLEFTARNAAVVQFTATRFDFARYVAESVASLRELRSYFNDPVLRTKSWQKYLQKETVRWSETLPPDQENRTVAGTTQALFTAPGTYVVESRVAGNKKPARILVIVTDILLLGKNAQKDDQYSTLLVACDAHTGRPLPNRALHVYEHWQEPDRPARKGAEHTDRQTFITDADGAVFWVQGPRFDGRAYRSNELELIPDKRSYRVGETAHLLIHTAGDNARVIFGRPDPHRVLNAVRFVDVPGRSVVVDVPVDESFLPDAAVEATVVHEGRLYTETCELVVPAEAKLLNLTVRTDKDVYGPGDTGIVHVEATDKAGRPAAGQVALAVFDKAVTYIQPDASTGPGGVFYGRKNYHYAEADSSFDQGFEGGQATNGPEEYPNRVPAPEGWDGAWKLGAKADGTPLWELLRARVASPDQIVITGSNIPSAQEAGPPTLLGDDPVAKPRAVLPNSSGLPAAKPVDPLIRTRFADTALWLPALKLDANGQADAQIDFPQSLSTWRLHGYAVNADTQIGEATAQATTTRRLLVRLLALRFFTERDEAVLSAAVNNDFPDAQT